LLLLLLAAIDKEAPALDEAVEAEEMLIEETGGLERSSKGTETATPLSASLRAGVVD